MEYRIWNNTDLREGIIYTSKRAADRAWRAVRPGSNAGNAYAASYDVRCSTCGGWQDVTVDHLTCACTHH